MSLLTESGRKTARQQRNYLATTLRRHEWFAQVPQQVVGGFALMIRKASFLSLGPRVAAISDSRSGARLVDVVEYQKPAASKVDRDNGLKKAQPKPGRVPH
jgi:hypothetical protein